MAVQVKPAGSSLSAQTANQLCLTVSFLEQYKKPRRCRRSTPIQTTVSYSTGDLALNGTTLFVPIIATVTAVYLTCDGGTSSKTFVETFTVSFFDQDALTTGAVIMRQGSVTDVSTSCCGITNLLLDDAISITVG